MLLVLFDFAADQLGNAGAQGVRRNQQLAIVVDYAVAGHHIKQILDVIVDILIGHEEPQVGIDLGRSSVVVTGTDVRVALKFAFFSANNEAELGMNFEAGKTVHNVHTVAFHFFSPVNVLLFVEPSLQLNDGGHLFAAATSFKKSLSNRRIAAAAVKRLLNSDNVRIQSCLLQEFQHAVKRVIRVVDKDVALADLVKAIAALFKSLRCLRMIGRILQRRAVNLHHAAEFGEGQRNTTAVELVRMKI